MSTKPIRSHDPVWEVARLREETGELIKELDSRGPTAALKLRARDLRKRFRAQGRALDQAIALEEGVAIAFRQRTGREPVDGDDITPADDALAGQIATALLRPGGLTN